MSSPGPSSRSEPEIDGSRSEAEICSLLEEASKDIERKDEESSIPEGSLLDSFECIAIEDKVNIDKIDAESSNCGTIGFEYIDIHDVSLNESSIEEIKTFRGLEAMEDMVNIENADSESSNSEISVVEIDSPESSNSAETSIEEIETFPGLENVDVATDRPALKREEPKQLDQPQLKSEGCPAALEQQWLQSREALANHDVMQQQNLPVEELAIQKRRPRREFPEQVADIVSDKPDFKLEKPKQPKLKSKGDPAPSLHSRVASASPGLFMQQRLSVKAGEMQELSSSSETTEQVAGVASNSTDLTPEQPQQLEKTSLKSHGSPASMPQGNQSMEDQARKGETGSGKKGKRGKKGNKKRKRKNRKG